MQNGIPQYPQRNVVRTVGTATAPGLIGGGFMHKTRMMDFDHFDSPRYVAVVVLAGRGGYRDDETGETYELRPGTLFQRIPGRRQSNWLDPASGWYECYLETGTDFARSLAAMRILNWEKPVWQPVLPSDFADTVWRFLDELSGAPEELLPELALRQMGFWRQFRERPAPLPDAVARPVDLAVELAREKLAQEFAKPFDLNKFCRRQGCGYEHFRKQFKLKTGISPWQYRVKRRLDRAAELVLERGATLGEIAAQLGYSSEYEFSAQFKRAFGVAPRFFNRSASAE